MSLLALSLTNFHPSRVQIAGMLGFASIYQQPMVGTDVSRSPQSTFFLWTLLMIVQVCGFLGDAEEKMCARWTTLGAFSPFFRNHADGGSVSQEYYRWPLVANAARYAIDIRYRLLDYFYTALHRQTENGTPAVSPLWFFYPQDKETFPIDMQYLYGDCVLVSPVTADDATDVSIYLPDDIFYEFDSQTPVRGRGEWVDLADVPFDRIPLHIRGGCILPLRAESANTTAALRQQGFELVVAPGLDGTARGSLYVDDGVSLDGGRFKVKIEWEFAGGELTTAVGGFSTLEEAGVRIEKVTILGKEEEEEVVDGPQQKNEEL